MYKGALMLIRMTLSSSFRPAELQAYVPTYVTVYVRMYVAAYIR